MTYRALLRSREKGETMGPENESTKHVKHPEPRTHSCLTDVSGTRLHFNELSEVSATAIDVLPNVPKYPVPVKMSYRTYRSVWSRYWCRTDLTEVSGTGNTGGMPRYVPYWTHHFCMLFTSYPLDYQVEKKWTLKTKVSLNFKEDKQFAFLRLILTRVRFRAVAKTNLIFVCTNWNGLLMRTRPRRRYSGHWFVCSCDSSAVQLGFWT